MNRLEPLANAPAAIDLHPIEELGMTPDLATLLTTLGLGQLHEIPNPPDNVDIFGRFDCRDAAQRAVDRYGYEYPVCAYGTHFESIRRNGELWDVRGARAASCD